MSVSLGGLSKCGNYVATVNTDVCLVIHEVSGKEYRLYDLGEILRDNDIEDAGNGEINITQLTWELVLEGNISRKIGVLVDNFNVVLIFDFSSEIPIIIHQAQFDGIEKFSWIPPVEDTDEGYTNCKQLVLFSKCFLKLKLYSLDATHMLFQIILPSTKSILIRPRHNMWSVIANTMEYNQPPIMYHFENLGSTSQLVHNFRFPHMNTSKIEWSPDGKWLSCFNDEDNLVGFQLQVFPMFGMGNPAIGKEIMSLKWLQEGITAKQITSLDYHCNWLGQDLIITSINDNNLQILYVDMKILKITKNFQDSPKLNFWKQVRDKGRLIYKPTSSGILGKIVNVYTGLNYIIIQLTNTILIYRTEQNQTYDNITDLSREFFELKAGINISLKVVSVEIHQGDDVEVLIVTHNHVLTFANGNVQVLYESNESIIEGSINQSQLIVATEATWRRINLELAVNIKPRKRLLEGLINTSIDVTDTFAKKKRIET